jgi:HSP20 family protein
MTTTLPTRISRGLSALRGRDPFRALQQEFDDLLSHFSEDWGGDWPARMSVPSLDVSETAEAVQVRMDIPGMEAKDIGIEVTGNMLSVSGERKEEREEKGKTWHRIERKVGSFARSVSLPSAVMEDKVEAAYKDGVLTITLPKTEEAKTHKVKVKGNGSK